jgi:hypothetical protein
MSDISGAVKGRTSTSETSSAEQSSARQTEGGLSTQVVPAANRENLAANLMTGGKASPGSKTSVLGFTSSVASDPEQSRLQNQLEALQQDQREAYRKQRELRDEIVQSGGSFSSSAKVGPAAVNESMSPKDLKESILSAGKFVSQRADMRSAIALSAAGEKVIDDYSGVESKESVSTKHEVVNNPPVSQTKRKVAPIEGASEINTDQIPEKAKAKTSWFGSLFSNGGHIADVIGLAVVGVGKLAYDSLALVGKGVHHLVTDPLGSAAACAEFSGKVLSVAATVGKVLLKGAVALGTWCYNHPLEAAAAVASGLLAVGKFAVSLVVGLVSGFIGGCIKVARGEMSIGEALVNTFRFCCDISGLTDLVLTGYHGMLAFGAYAKGDKTALAQHLALTAMHGAFAGLAILTVGSGGILAPVTVPLMAGRAVLGMAAKQGLKACAKELLEIGSKQIAKESLEKMGAAAAKKLGAESPHILDDIARVAQESLGKDLTEKSLQAKINELAFKRVCRLEGDTIALTHGKSLNDDLIREGRKVLSKQHTEALGEKIGHERMRVLHKELGLVDHIDELTHDSLVKFRDMKPKEINKHLVETYQLSEKQAAKTAKEMKRLLDSGKSDQAIKDLLIKDISKDIWKVASPEVEAAYKETFRKGLRGELTDAANGDWSRNLRKEILEHADDLAKSRKTNPLGKAPTQLADDLTDDLVEAGWKGVERGGYRATQELVEEGVECAFKRLSGRRLRGSAGHGDSGREDRRSRPDELTEVDGLNIGDARSAGRAVERHAGESFQPEVESFEVVRDGKVYRVTNIYNDAKDLLRSIESIIGEAANGADKKSVRLASEEAKKMGQVVKDDLSLKS